MFQNSVYFAHLNLNIDQYASHFRAPGYHEGKVELAKDFFLVWTFHFVSLENKVLPHYTPATLDNHFGFICFITYH